MPRQALGRPALAWAAVSAVLLVSLAGCAGGPADDDAPAGDMAPTVLASFQHDCWLANADADFGSEMACQFSAPDTSGNPVAFDGRVNVTLWRGVDDFNPQSPPSRPHAVKFSWASAPNATWFDGERYSGVVFDDQHIPWYDGARNWIALGVLDAHGQRLELLRTYSLNAA